MSWDTEGLKGRGISINMIDDFDARGLRRLYVRTDVFPKAPLLNMAIWTDRKERLFARFWSRSEYVEWESYEIIGIKPEQISRIFTKNPDSDEWIPECLRDAYDDWIIYEDW